MEKRRRRRGVGHRSGVDRRLPARAHRAWQPSNRVNRRPRRHRHRLQSSPLRSRSHLCPRTQTSPHRPCLRPCRHFSSISLLPHLINRFQRRKRSIPTPRTRRRHPSFLPVPLRLPPTRHNLSPPLRIPMVYRRVHHSSPRSLHHLRRAAEVLSLLGLSAAELYALRIC